MPICPKSPIPLAALLLAALGAAAHAEDRPVNDATAVVHAGIPLTRAIGIAEQAENGKAAGARYEPIATGAAYRVEVVTSAGVVAVTVDADKGTVIGTKPDDDDAGEDD
jgi:uncharacterized membrane protein YkoI